MELSDVTGENFVRAQFSEHEFELLCRKLLDHECEARHRASVVVAGPGKAKVGDKGCDLLVEVRDVPKTARADFFHALTFDSGVTWYSCKTGHTWKTTIQRDLGYAAFNAWRKKKKRPGSKSKRPSEELLEHLSQGGRLVFVIAEQAQPADRSAFLQDVADCLTFWLEHTERAAPDEFVSHFHLVDANHLAAFVSKYRPALPSSLRGKLGALEPLGLQTWDEWTRELEARDQRTPVPFEADGERERIMRALAPRPDGHEVVWIVGAPGVGKTRLVHEAFVHQPAVHMRVRYTDQPRDGLEILRSSWLEDVGPIVLIIDEVSKVDVDDARVRFAAHARPGSLLILIGPKPEAAITGVENLALGGLGDAACRRLVADILGEDPADLRRGASVLRLAEGYPLFAVRLARALEADGDSLERGTDADNRWDAACRVIAGPKVQWQSTQLWQEEADLCARCLLAVILVGDRDWDELSESAQAGLAQILDQDWPTIRRAEERCRERGLLRRTAGSPPRRYVSPHNLARIIINRFFINRFFAGPDGLGPRISRHLPEYVVKLQNFASYVEAAESVRKNLARAVLAECMDSSREYTMAYLVRLRDLWNTATTVPEETARTIVSMARAAADADALAEDATLWHVTRSALKHLVHRRLSSPAFADVEEALFLMALVDDSPWSNNTAGLWVHIFQIHPSYTHASWEWRFERLRQRVAQGASERRVLALRGLAAAVSSDPVDGAMFLEPRDDTDGPWPQLDPEGIARARADAWTLLIELSTDTDQQVAHQARHHVRALVRRGLHDGSIQAQHLSALVDSVTSWSVMERHALRGALAQVTLDDTQGDDTHPLASSVRELERALAPEDVQSHVMTWVGRDYTDWADDHAGTGIGTGIDIESVARELLEQPADFARLLDWLESDRAVRAPSFLRILGRLDTSEALWPLLQERATTDQGAATFGAYLRGRYSSSSDRVDAWIEAHLEHRPYTRAVVSALVGMALDDRHLDWLATLLGHSEVPEAWLRPLGDIGRRAAMSPGGALTFIEFLGRSDAYRELALRMAVSLVRHTADFFDGTEHLDLVASHLRQTAGSALSTAGDTAWRRAAMYLAERGRGPQVIDAALVRLESEGRRGRTRTAEEVLQRLVAQGRAGDVWQRISRALIEEPSVGLQRSLARVGLLEAMGPATVLAWVALDEERALAVIPMLELRQMVDIDVIPRTLLLRFGATGRVARALVEQMFRDPTRMMMSDDISVYQAQLEQARAWLSDAEPPVRQWARSLVEECARIIEAKRADQEFERIYLGA